MWGQNVADDRIIFRRVKGRIIPIRLKKRDERVKGAGFISGGVGVSAATGFAAGKASERVIFRSAAAETLTRLAAGKGRTDLGTLKIAAKALKGAKRAAFFGRSVQALGVLAGGILISEGIKKFKRGPERKISEKQFDPEGEIISQLGGAAAAVASTLFFKRSFGLRPDSFKRVSELIKKRSR